VRAKIEALTAGEQETGHASRDEREEHEERGEG
jgi:hypothetical protein